jgi:hypothetical protein
MRVFAFLIFLFSSLAGRAQTVTGTVVDETTGKPLRGATVTSGRQPGLETMTDGDGRFSIAGSGGETFRFTAPGYALISRRVPEYLGSVPWKVTMHVFGANLEEVRVKPFSEGYQLDSFDRVSTYKRVLSRQKSSALSPVSFLMERISKKQRALFKFQEEFGRMEDDRFIESRYTRELAGSLTGLTGDTLGNFMVDNPMPFDYARAATDLEIKMWIRAQYREWILKD